MSIILGQWIIMALMAGSTAECETGCSTCNGNGNGASCSKCFEKYYLDRDTCIPCPDKCRQCLQDYTCTLCDSPYFGSTYPHCDKTCPNNCNQSGCDAVTGFCFGCQQGFYGTKCEQKCDLCINDRCDRHTCFEGCKMGYFQIASSAKYSDCLPCKDNCAVCSNVTYCTSCKAGFVSFREDYDCIDCKLYIAGCKQYDYRSAQVICDACQEGYYLEDNTCVANTCPNTCLFNCHNNGTCIGGCKAGYSGGKCDILCNESCKSCDQFDRNKCVTLTDPTNYCNYPFNSNCVILTGHETYNTTGFCLNGCLDGFWDITCNRSCNIGCNVSCDRMTGECYTCERMRYGKFCNKNCSENCLNNDTLNDVCTKDLGKCLQGCKPGFAGTYCTQATLMSTQDLTLRTKPTPMPTTSPAKLESVVSKNVMVGAVVGALVGAILIGAGSVSVFCILKRRLMFSV